MITDNYINQCEQAEEIQKLCQFKKGDWFYNGEKPVLFCKSGLGSFNPHEHKWLPTLEQLFELAHKELNKEAYYKAKEYEIIADFIEWMLNCDIDRYKDFNLDFNDTKSCLLIHIMERFYKKAWTGEKWEAIK